MPRRDAVSSPLVHGLHRYWRERSEGGRPMRRARLDPVELPGYLRYLFLSRIYTDPLRVKYIVVGTQIVRACGLDFTGRWLDEVILASTAPEDWVGHYERMLRDEQPVFGQTSEQVYDGRWFEFEWAMLPLLGTGDRIEFCLGIEDHMALGDSDDETGVASGSWPQR